MRHEVNANLNYYVQYFSIQNGSKAYSAFGTDIIDEIIKLAEKNSIGLSQLHILRQ